MTSLFRSFTSTLLSIGLIALLVQGAFAHTYLSSLIIDGTALAEGDCVRPHPNPGFDDPITLVSSVNMTLGFLPQAAQPANRACPIAAGATMGVQWHHENDLPGDDILDASHKGPIMFYLAKSDTGAGNVWFKIWESGYDASTGLWATDVMIAAGGVNTFTIPADIAPGNYLLRAEVIALHQAEILDGAQPYVGAAELTISGSGTANPAGVAFPGAYKDTDPGILFNIYTTITSYPIPGPAVYVAGSSSSSSGSSGSSSPSTVAPSTPAPTKTTSAPTTKPSKTPTSAPTTKATTAPTTKPSKTPTAAPTTKPVATTKPSKTSTPAPSSSSTPLTVELNQGASTWWIGVIVAGGSQAVSKVEITDSGAVKSWTALQNAGYAYIYSPSAQLVLPVSVRITSASGAQVTLTSVFTSWTVSLINTGKDFSGATANDEPTPVSPAPESPVTESPETSEPASGASVTVWSGSNQYWIGVAVAGVENVASVEIKDSAALTSYALMTTSTWGGYYLNSLAEPFALPATIRVTDETGASVTATLDSFTAGAVSPAA